jgi:Phage tail assembly chaperone
MSGYQIYSKSEKPNTPDFSAQVHAELPSDNARVQKVNFTVRFKRLSTTEFDSLITRINEKDSDGNRQLTDQDIVNEVLTGFGSDLQDENGNALEFTPENIAALCDVHPMRPTLVQAFFESYNKAKAKN